MQTNQYKFQRIKRLLLNLTLLCCTVYTMQIEAAPTEMMQHEIQRLISKVHDSNCVFNRNGVDYAGIEAAGHIEKKRDYFKKDIHSTEDFIRLSATKSEMSGKLYTVQCGDGAIQPLGDWLAEALLTLRKIKPE